MSAFAVVAPDSRRLLLGKEIRHGALDYTLLGLALGRPRERIENLRRGEDRRHVSSLRRVVDVPVESGESTILELVRFQERQPLDVRRGTRPRNPSCAGL